MELVTVGVSRLSDEFPGVDVEVSMPESARIETTGQPWLVVEELLSNAVKHNDRANPSVAVSIRETDGGVALTVADDGPGIPEHERALITGEREATQLDHGSGIGLWTVAWMVRSMGGDLSIANNDPRGTVATVWWARSPEE